MMLELKNYIGCCAKDFEIVEREKTARTRTE